MIAEVEAEAEVEPPSRSGSPPLDPIQLEHWRRHLEQATPVDLLRWTLSRFGEKAALVTAFQAEGLVLLDMVHRLLPDAEPRVITIDTGRLPQETYDLIDQVRERYGVEVEVVFPRAEAVTEMVHRRGVNLFYRSPEDRRACCQTRKVEPLGRLLESLDAWITGLRRQQSSERAAIEPLELDETHGGLWKLNPLAHWSWQEVWDYIELHNVPYHAFYDRGYTTIGCAPCTRAVRPGADPRSGRWWWEEEDVSKECGLHLSLPVITEGAHP